jgi:hypothetical protein
LNNEVPAFWDWGSIAGFDSCEAFGVGTREFAEGGEGGAGRNTFGGKWRRDKEEENEAVDRRAHNKRIEARD